MNLFSKVIYHFALIVFISYQGSELTAQTLTEEFKGVKTEFEISWRSQSLDIIDQAIYKRGYSHYQYDEEPINEHAFGFGYGMQTYQLEFMTKNNINVITRKDHRKFKYLIQLMDSEKNTLLKRTLNRSEIVRYTNGADLQTISINLQGLPLIALEKTTSIFITFGRYD